jgi:hypothetical protein
MDQTRMILIRRKMAEGWLSSVLALATWNHKQKLHIFINYRSRTCSDSLTTTAMMKMMRTARTDKDEDERVSIASCLWTDMRGKHTKTDTLCLIVCIDTADSLLDILMQHNTTAADDTEMLVIFSLKFKWHRPLILLKTAHRRSGTSRYPSVRERLTKVCRRQSSGLEVRSWYTQASASQTPLSLLL